MAEEKDEYKKLIGKVGGHKSFLTRLGGGVDAVVAAEALDGPALLAAEEQESNTRSRLDKIQETFDNIRFPEIKLPKFLRWATGH